MFEKHLTKTSVFHVYPNWVLSYKTQIGKAKISSVVPMVRTCPGCGQTRADGCLATCAFSSPKDPSPAKTRPEQRDTVPQRGRVGTVAAPTGVTASTTAARGRGATTRGRGVGQRANGSHAQGRGKGREEATSQSTDAKPVAGSRGGNEVDLKMRHLYSQPCGDVSRDSRLITSLSDTQGC